MNEKMKEKTFELENPLEIEEIIRTEDTKICPSGIFTANFGPVPSIDIPEIYRCPITQAIMFDPVVLLATNQTYEREAIEKWLKNSDLDPITSIKLDNKALREDFFCKSVVRQFIDQNPSLWETDEIYFSAALVSQLSAAIQKDDTNQVSIYLARDPRLLKRNLQNDKNLLILACETASFKMLDFILNRLKVRDFDCVSADKGIKLLHLLYSRFGILGAQRWVTAVNWSPADCQMFYEDSIANSNVERAEILINLGIDPNRPLSKSKEGNRALHEAAATNNQSMVKALLNKGALIKVKNQDGKTPIDLARTNGNSELANWMIHEHQRLKLQPFLQPLKEDLQKQLQEKLLPLQQKVEEQKGHIEKHEKILKIIGSHTNFFKNSVCKYIDKLTLKSDKKIEGVTVLPNERLIVSCSEAREDNRYYSRNKYVREVKIWDIDTGKCLKTFNTLWRNTYLTFSSYKTLCKPPLLFAISNGCVITSEGNIWNIAVLSKTSSQKNLTIEKEKDSYSYEWNLNTDKEISSRFDYVSHIMPDGVRVVGIQKDSYNGTEYLSILDSSTGKKLGSSSSWPFQLRDYYCMLNCNTIIRLREDLVPVPRQSDASEYSKYSIHLEAFAIDTEKSYSVCIESRNESGFTRSKSEIKKKYEYEIRGALPNNKILMKWGLQNDVILDLSHIEEIKEFSEIPRQSTTPFKSYEKAPPPFLTKEQSVNISQENKNTIEVCKDGCMQFLPHDAEVSCFSVLPDNNTIISAAGNTIKIWENQIVELQKIEQDMVQEFPECKLM